jgi:uncharacterized LabA/DUF88 family protein
VRDSILLLDLDNHYIPLRNGGGRAYDVAETIHLAGGWERLAEIRGYADMGSLPISIRHQLQRNAVTCIDVPCRLSDGRRISDAVDTVISMDMVEIGLTRPEIREVVLGGGDHRYLFAIARAQRDGKHVSLIGVQGSVSAELHLLVGEAIQYLKGGRLLRPAA